MGRYVAAMDTVYLNGEYLPHDKAFVSVDDRGFLLGDACYEATAIHHGRCAFLDRHLARLADGLAEIRIEFDVTALVPVHDELIRRNRLADASLAMIYLQVTRGVAPRTHAFPIDAVTPTVYAATKTLSAATPADFDRGSSAITHPDLRWLLPRIKATGLLPNVLAQQAATEAGVTDVVLHRDGVVTEGAHNNIFIVNDNRLITAPADDLVLAGVTRAVVIDLARAAGIPVDERRIELDELFAADEVFLTGTTTEIRPTVTIDDRPIGSGRPGPVTRRVHSLYTAALD